MFLVTGIVYITSPNIFALSQYALKRNVTLMPETAKIECEYSLIYLYPLYECPP